MSPPACSTVLATVATSVEIPVAAKATLTMSTPTSAGEPQLAWTSTVVATASVVIAMSPRANPAIDPPSRIDDGRIGAARRRFSVPAWRSPRRARAPYWTAKKTNMIAIAAP